jgi:tetratricopeptide (TPR) repeat protein
MTRRIRKTIWPTLLVLFLLSAAWAQAQGSGQQQNPPKPPAQPAQPGQPAPAPPVTSGPPINKEEEDAYKTFFELKGDPQRKIQLGEEFLKKFPESRYREGIYSLLASSYLDVGQTDKMFAAGEKALELNPKNVDVLSLLVLVMPRRVSPNALDADQKLEKSEKYGKQAVALLEGMQKPAGLSDEDFAKAKNEKLSMCHSGLGIAYFHRQKYADSAVELEQATKLAAVPDPTDFFVLGLAYMNTKRFSDAASAFGHCGSAPGPLQERCKQGMEQAKKQAATQLAPPK